MKELTKEEAIQAMKDGHKVTHRHFTSDEYMFMPNPRANKYQFEDGVSMLAYEFWQIRSDPSYLTGWSLFDKK